MNQKTFTGEYMKENYNHRINVDSDEEIDAFIKASSHSGYHLSCTNRMGV